MIEGNPGTPLVKKLGIKENFKLKVINSPVPYTSLVDGIPKNAVFIENAAKNTLDFLHIFTNSVVEYEKLLLEFKDRILPDGEIWISWPKKKSKITSDLDENKIRDFALLYGLVDVKVCAVNHTWSGLKLVYRVKNREQIEK